jgi:hypothetical protein
VRKIPETDLCRKVQKRIMRLVLTNDFEEPYFIKNQPIRLSGLKPGVCSGLILSGAYPDLNIGVWRRRTYQIPAKEGGKYED